MSFFFGMMFVVLGVYYVTVVELNPLQLVLVGTTVETTIFLFEVPTGVLADIYSRRLSVIIGDVVIGIAYVVQGALSFFGGILLAQVLWGIGETFVSGAFDAWIADEIGEEKAGRVYLRASQVGMFGGMAGTVTGAVLGSLDLRLPILLGGMLFIALAAFLAVFMPEDGFRPAPREQRRQFSDFTRTFRAGVQQVRGRPVLITILLIGAVYGAFTEGYDRLNEAHFLTNLEFPAIGGLQPVAWFAVLSIVGGLLGLVVTEIARRRIDTNSHVVVARSLLVISGLLSAAVISFGLAGSFAMAASTSLLIHLMRTLRGPLTTAWINQNVDLQVRATVISMSGQADALGQLAVGPGIGAIGTAFGLRTALVLAGILLAPVLLLYTRTLRRGRPPLAVAEAEAEAM